jgi:hypothetical protein
MKKYQIICSEEQLMLIAKAVEDWHRFLAGQTEMWNASGLLDNGREVMRRLATLHPIVTPRLPRGASYDWSGNGCPNPWQRKAIAMSYGIYREILHHLTVQSDLNVYTSPTLTCEEQGELITIKKINK